MGREQEVRNLLRQVVHEQLQHLPVLLWEPVNEAVDLRDSGLLVFQLWEGRKGVMFYGSHS